MKKFGVFVFVIVLILAVSVVATATEISPETQKAVEQVLDEIVQSEVAEEVQEYVEEFVEKRGIDANKITDVSEIDFDALPKEVNIENIDDTNLVIYEVNYEEAPNDERKIYVITYSTEELKTQGDLIIAHDKRQFLNFGYSGKMNQPSFLTTSAGVESSLEKGYVMVRPGSITAISTNLEVGEEGSGQVKIIIYKNGEAIRFGNSIDASSSGVKKDYDVQSNGVVTFQPGDVISAYVEGSNVEDVITMVEITTIN